MSGQGMRFGPIQWKQMRKRLAFCLLGACALAGGPNADAHGFGEGDSPALRSVDSIDAFIPRDWPRIAPPALLGIPSAALQQGPLRSMGYSFLRHIKLLTSIVAGVVLFFVLPGHWSSLARVLVSW